MKTRKNDERELKELKVKYMRTNQKYVCIYSCMYVCMYVYIHVCMYVYMYVLFTDKIINIYKTW